MMPKQLLMDETNEGLPMPDDVQNNCWWIRQMKEFIPDVVRKLFMDETDEGIHTKCRKKQLLMDKTNEGLPIPDDVQNNWCMIREMK